ncbi:hypothetical protein BC940DRAFT_298449 [Gongronella butleri]|nr:hypothetical protein BC940DRAFT_298449 [Gongronella butleri]
MATSVIKFLVCIFMMCIIVQANPHCQKNAWVRVTVTSKSSGGVQGRVNIQEGKDAWDISDGILSDAIGECLFEKQRCYASKTGDLTCNTAYEWESERWVGAVNIEFWCDDGLYTCYNAGWNRY